MIIFASMNDKNSRSKYLIIFVNVYHVFLFFKHFFVCDVQHVFFIKISIIFLIVDEKKIRNIYYFLCFTIEYSAKYFEIYYQFWFKKCYIITIKQSNNKFNIQTIIFKHFYWLLITIDRQNFFYFMFLFFHEMRIYFIF